MADAAVAVEETQQLEEAGVSPLEESLLARARPVAFTSPFEAEMAAALSASAIAEQARERAKRAEGRRDSSGS